MRLDDLRQMIITSDRERDWNEIAPGSYFTDVPNVDEDTFEWHDSLIVYRPDVNLSIQWGMRSRQLNHIEKASQLWRENGAFPDPKARAVHADVFWSGSLVDRVHLVYVDGHRALLPVGDQHALNYDDTKPPGKQQDITWKYTATEWEAGLARLLDGGRQFDSYLQRTGIVIEG